MLVGWGSRTVCGPMGCAAKLGGAAGEGTMCHNGEACCRQNAMVKGLRQTVSKNDRRERLSLKMMIKKRETPFITVVEITCRQQGSQHRNALES